MDWIQFLWSKGLGFLYSSPHTCRSKAARRDFHNSSHIAPLLKLTMMFHGAWGALSCTGWLLPPLQTLLMPLLSPHALCSRGPQPLSVLQRGHIPSGPRAFANACAWNFLLTYFFYLALQTSAHTRSP